MSEVGEVSNDVDVVPMPRETTPADVVAPPAAEAGASESFGVRARRLGISIGGSVRHLTVWHWALAAVLVAYVIHFTSLTVDMHNGTGSSSFDVGLYDQGIWLMSRFKSPFVTLMGRNLMGDHTSFILVFLVPVYWVFPGISTLYFVQTLALAAGAIPVFMYARRRLGSAALATFCGIAYLLHPAVAFTNLENFHPDAFLGVLVGFAIYGALERKWKLYAVFVVLSLLVKEDVSLVVVPLGIWVALRRDRRKGLITIIASLGFMAFAMFVVVKSLLGVVTRNSWRIPFGGPSKFISHSLKHPGDLVDHLRADGRPFYLWQMAAPFAFVFARVPDVALIGALVLFTNVLSTYSYQYDIAYHYSLIAVPALAIGTVHALGAIKGRARVALVGVVSLTALWTSYIWGAMPFSTYQVAYWAPNYPVAEQLREIVKEIPSNAAVSAYHSATTHIAHREDIYQFPNPFRLVLYGVDVSLEQTRIDWRAESIEYVLLPRSLSPENQAAWLEVAAAFDIAEENESWVLYVRDPDVPIPPLPDPTAPPQLPGG